GHAHRYASWRQSPSEPAPPLEGVDAHRAAAVLSATLAQGPGWLPPAAVTALLACYGLAPAESVLVATPHDAGDAAKKLGGKVALKGLVAGLIRKSDAGAVRLDLEGSHEVEAAAKDIAQRMAAIGQKVQAFMVQRMAPAGVEMLVGVVQDRHFGPVLAVAQRFRVDLVPAFDELRAGRSGLFVIHGEHRIDHAVAQIEHREMEAVAVAAPHRLVLARCVAAVLEADVVLVGPEIRDLGVRSAFACRDRGGDAAALALGDLPVLDADRAGEERMVVE